MKQAELRNRLRAMRIFNDHGLLTAFGEKGSTDVCVDYRSHRGERTGYPQTHVWSPSWADYGAKTFGGNRAESFPLAMDWVTEHYPAVLIWVTSPLDRSAKVPAQVVAAAIAKVKAAG